MGLLIALSTYFVLSRAIELAVRDYMGEDRFYAFLKANSGRHNWIWLAGYIFILVAGITSATRGG